MSANVTSVVIMNMHYSGLGVARALADSDIPIIGLSFDRAFFGNYTRFARVRQYPDPQFRPDDCLQFLEELSEELGGNPLLLPTRDIDIQFIIDNRDALQRRYTIPYPGNDIVNTIISKDQLYRIAREIDIPCPSEVVVSNLAEFEEALSGLEFPVIAKPVVATEWRNPEVWEQVGRAKVRRFGTPMQLREFYENLSSLSPRLSLQSYIRGPDSNLRIIGAFKAPSGEYAFFALRKLLQYPKEAGTGIVLETCQDDSLAEKSDRLLSALGYHGIAEIEFKFDSTLRDYVLIEVNPRHWDQHFLGTKVGVNLTKTQVDYYNNASASFPVQKERTVKWIADDQYLINLLRAVLHREYSARYCLSCIRGKKSFAVFSFPDPLPFAAMTWFAVKNLIKRVLDRFRDST
jgi:predicted ATP-grasp superfamily ATP-dependent carboligase